MVLQSCSSRKRCLRQYWWLQLSQREPMFWSVLIMVLQLDSEHLVGERPVRVGPDKPVLLMGVPTEFLRRFLAHSPA